MFEKLACPKCGSHKIETDDYYDLNVCGVLDNENLIVDGLSEEAVGHCLKCGAELQWSKIYRFIGYDNITVNE